MSQLLSRGIFVKFYDIAEGGSLPFVNLVPPRKKKNFVERAEATATLIIRVNVCRVK